MAAFRGISHCYQRPTYADWPYSVFTMAHGRSKEECDAVLDAIAEPTGHQRARDAVLEHRVQEGPDALLHRRRSGAGKRSTPELTSSLTDTRSAELYRRALHVLPGGVNSPVRAMRAIGRDPIFIERADGAEITDVDGNIYVDYVCSWGPLIHGHAHPAGARGGGRRRPRAGTTFGAPTAGEVELAELVAAADAVGRHAAHDLVGHRGVDERDPARARRHRPRHAAQVRRRLPRPRRRAARRGRLRPGHAGHPRLARACRRRPPRRPSSCPWNDPEAVARRVRRARARRDPGRALPGQHGPRPARAGLPRAAARARAPSTARCWSSTRSSPASASPPAARRS